jgi:hypothetical protein
MPADGSVLQTHVITKRSKYQPLEVKVGCWMRLVKDNKYATPHELSDKADEAIGVLLERTFPPTKREERYAINCPHAPGDTCVKYVYLLIGDKSPHLIGTNEFLMRMWLEKPSPPSVDGANTATKG